MTATREIHFRDQRRPNEIQAELERELMTVLTPVRENSRLSYQATVKINGAPHHIELRFDAALMLTCCYSLRIDLSCEGLPAPTRDYQLESFPGWFKLWTRSFKPRPDSEAGTGSAGRYERRVQDALAAEGHLTGVAELQQEILESLRQGASFATAHKEGGTTIRWINHHFESTDYGESNARRVFPAEAEFLAYLRKFYHWETSRNVAPATLSELEAWRLIRRLLRPPA